MCACKRPFMNESVWGIVAAAGEARRFGSDKLAQRLPNGDTILYRSCAQLISGGIDRLVVVGSPGPSHRLDRLAESIYQTVPGGSQRSDSIKAGLAVIPSDVQWIAVHDGARPFATADLIKRCVAAAQATGAAVPVLECIDTIARVQNTQLSGALDRTELRRIQTPQIMRRAWLEQVLAQTNCKR